MGDLGTEGALTQLETLRRRRDEIDKEMTLLMAYMREKVKPRPYTLQQIAAAAGMSISGIRTFYDAEDIAALDEWIERRGGVGDG